VHLDAGYDSTKTRTLLADRGLHGEIAHKGEKAPIQASRRWHVERTNAWHNGFNRFQRCYERRERVIDAYFDRTPARPAPPPRSRLASWPHAPTCAAARSIWPASSAWSPRPSDGSCTATGCPRWPRSTRSPGYRYAAATPGSATNAASLVTCSTSM